jgi:type I restriction enzyme R subunit
VNEADTRANLIDPKLKAVGWHDVEQSFIRREVICPGRIIPGGMRGKGLACDYVLIYRNKKLAVIEAKKESLSYTEGVRQAKEYAERLQCQIAYAANGREIYQMDLKTGEEKSVDEFLSPDQLWALTFEKQQESDFTIEWRKRFAAVPFETKGGSWQPRYYQDNAIQNALEAIAKGCDRILLTMATGTGKTSIAFQIAWKLFQSRWSLNNRINQSAHARRPRILFLADRNILADQALNDFSPFGDDAIIRIAPDEIKKHARVPKNGSVFFTIFQTFMSGRDENDEPAPYFGDYPQDFFDFIVIDECHRGGAKDESTWRQVLEYFSPAVQLGLTATPKRKDNVDTYAYFGEPVYIYTLKQGINDGFLTPFKVYPIVGTMDEYVYTPGDGQVIQGDPEPGKLYRENNFNLVIIIPEREERRVHYWMDRINPHDKTLVFCATQEHAGLVRDMINQYAVKQRWTTNPDYCVRVTSNDKTAGEKDLKIFQDNEKTIPTILTTSRKLSTGVNARNVRNIVLMRPCNNMIEFKQIIGRGTRLFDGKEFFTIFDFVKAHYNFADPEWDGDPIEEIKSTSKAKNNALLSEPTREPYAAEASEETKSEKIKIKLSDGKTRQIKHISSVMYWSPEGKPITAREFVGRMFHDLPQFFKNEDELREIWQNPDAREKLLQELSEAGYDHDKLISIQRLIEAENSDIYDVLAYIAYNTEVLTRSERVEHAKPDINQLFQDTKQQDFIGFILSKYVTDGVEELSPKKMRTLLELKYHTVSDAAALFGSTAKIRETFISFQKYLYQGANNEVN